MSLVPFTLVYARSISSSLCQLAWMTYASSEIRASMAVGKLSSVKHTKMNPSIPRATVSNAFSPLRDVLGWRRHLGHHLQRCTISARKAGQSEVGRKEGR